ncbi:HAD family hydrolase [Hydrogenimonas sp.]
MIEIPGYGRFLIEHIVCDYNGTIAKDGVLLPETIPLLKSLSATYRVHIVTADTFGSVEAQIAGLGVNLKILTSDDHTAEKRGFVEALGCERCAAIGNGNNDAQMLRSARIAVAVMGDEGCAAEALQSADILCRSGAEALALFANPKRMTATLRK